jgi:hypothetical protein
VSLTGGLQGLGRGPKHPRSISEAGRLLPRSSGLDALPHEGRAFGAVFPIGVECEQTQLLLLGIEELGRSAANEG